MEQEIARVFARLACHRIKHNFSLIDDNDDELIKRLADQAFDAGRYGWDVI